MGAHFPGCLLGTAAQPVRQFAFALCTRCYLIWTGRGGIVVPPRGRGFDAFPGIPVLRPQGDRTDVGEGLPGRDDRLHHLPGGRIGAPMVDLRQQGRYRGRHSIRTRGHAHAAPGGLWRKGHIRRPGKTGLPARADHGCPGRSGDSIFSCPGPGPDVFHST